LRLEAGLALANLKVTELRGWTSELQGLIVAKVLRELAAANLPAQQAAYWLTRFASSRALDGSIEQLKELSDAAGNLMRSAVANQGADAQPIEQWISQHENIKNRRFTAQSAEIRLPNGAAAAK
jgi:hypothetical protein